MDNNRGLKCSINISLDNYNGDNADPRLEYGLCEAFGEYKGCIYVVVARSILSCVYETWYVGIPNNIFININNHKRYRDGKHVSGEIITYYSKHIPNFNVDTPDQWAKLQDIVKWIGFDNMNMKVNHNAHSRDDYVKYCKDVIDDVINNTK